jgi:dTDP-4-dehydrorhamnose reductase
MVQISTDFVFDGTKGQPYWEFDLPNPVSTYGASKLAGEELARQILDRLYVVRTAWLYGPGGSHFVGRVLALAEQEQQLSVTTNEVGSPTMTDDLAEAVAALIGHGVYGTYHLVNEGQCSRYDFAQEIIRLAGLPQHVLKPVDRFPRPARVPAYAPLRNFVAASQLGIRLRPWRQALAAYINELGYSVRGAADPLAAEAAALPGV